MIRIAKPTEAPAILLKQGKRKRATLCRLYTRYTADYISGARKFSFDSATYGDQTVKQALMKAQYNKCSFCESKVGADGDVEHFRPKAGWSQGQGQPLVRPGYYWLAYEWDNLLLACSACNQRFKKNYFPLADPNMHATSHHEDLSREEPLFINPAERDPGGYIGFRHEIPYAIDDNPYGRATIASVGLDREIINERRRDRLGLLKVLYDIIRLEQSVSAHVEFREFADNARALLESFLRDDAEFAAAARAAYSDKFEFALT